MREFIYIVIFILGLSGCANNTKIIKENCSPPDNKNWVLGGEECFRIKTENAINNPKALIVLIHGDVSSGGPSDYLYKQVLRMNPKYNQFVIVTLIRPGYFDSEGNYSTGSDNNRKDHYTNHNIEAIASAIINLKKFYKPNKVVVAGHSGGAAITGSIIGKYPSLIDGAVLAACPCDIPRWRAMRKPWFHSLSPISFVKKVKGTNVVAIAGSRDRNTFPKLMRDYIEKLKASGINASFYLLEGATHNGTARSEKFFSTIVDLAK